MYARSMIILTFGGGTNEIQRDLIAIFGLGHAPVAALTGPRRETGHRRGLLLRRGAGGGTGAGRAHLHRAVDPRAAEGGRGGGRHEGPLRPRRSGPSWPRPACSASACPRTWAVPASTSWPSASWSRRPGRRPPTSRWSRPWPTAAGAVDRFGTEDQRRAWLPGVVDGDPVLTAALAELVGDVVVPGLPPRPPRPPGPAAGWRLDGAKACVPGGLAGRPGAGAGHADRRRRAAQRSWGLPGRRSGSAGVSRPRQDAAGRPEALIELTGWRCRADAQLGGPGADGAAIVPPRGPRHGRPLRGRGRGAAPPPSP